jgi:excisionase family DNA binding protein
MSTEALISELITIKQMLENLGVQQKEYLSREEAASYLGISVSTLNKLTANKEIVYYKPGGKVSLFKVQDLRDFVEKGKIDTAVDYSSIAKEMIKKFKK